MELTEDAKAGVADVAEQRAAVLSLDSAERHDELFAKLGIVKLTSVLELQRNNARWGGARSKFNNSRLHEREHV
jgi:hypothetical protein